MSKISHKTDTFLLNYPGIVICFGVHFFMGHSVETWWILNWHVFIELPRYSYLFWGPLFYGTQCRNVVNLKFFSGEIHKHHFTRAFLYYMAGPLLKSRRRPCSFCRPCSVGASTLCCGHVTRWCGRIGHSERYKRHAEAPHAFNSGWDPSGNTSKKIPRALRSAPPLWRRRTD